MRVWFDPVQQAVDVAQSKWGCGLIPCNKLLMQMGVWFDPMLHCRAIWHGLFCFPADVNDSEVSCVVRLCFIDYEQIIFYYIMYKYIYVW